MRQVSDLLVGPVPEDEPVDHVGLGAYVHVPPGIGCQRSDLNRRTESAVPPSSTEDEGHCREKNDELAAREEQELAKAREKAPRVSEIQ